MVTHILFLKEILQYTDLLQYFDQEFLAIYFAIKYFCHFIKGRIFHVYTDHKPLTFALASQSTSQSPRQLRHHSFISQFTNDICHIKGTENSVADALSRIEINSLSDQVVDFEKLAIAQKMRT